MIKLFQTLLIGFICFSTCYSQKKDTLFLNFLETTTFDSIEVFLKSNGEEVTTTFNNKKYYYDLSFYDIISKNSYIVNENGVWHFGINSSEPNYYLLFKYNQRLYFESCDYLKVIKRLEDFIINVHLSETEKVLLLFGILKYLNECNHYPIECINNCN